MAGAKLIVIYPRPTDIEAFDKRYQEEHVPMAVEKLGGKARIVATKVLGSPQGIPPSMSWRRSISLPWKLCKRPQNPREARRLLAHAVSISTGGSPIVLVAEEQSYNFD